VLDADQQSDMASPSRVLRVLLFQEGRDSLWAAQCLEYDIVAQGGSIREALDNFRDVFEGQIAFDVFQNRKPLSGKKQAPPWYWQALRDATPLRDSIPLKVPSQSWIGTLLDIFRPQRVAEPFVRG
jgi:hypothetical protein